MGDDQTVIKEKVVWFSEYRKYEEARKSVNDAMMGLLAGAGLAAHLLKSNEVVPGTRLAKIFPEVAHINRLNITNEKAIQIINTADTHLGAMSVPYALALHEDFITICLNIAVESKLCNNRKVRSANSSTQHSILEEACGFQFNSDDKIRLNTIRLMRNKLIHAGGIVDSGLVNDIQTWPVSVENEWVKITGRSPKQLKINNKLEFGQGEMILTLAVTKTLARQANVMLAKSVDRDLWADRFISDLANGRRSILTPLEFAKKAPRFRDFHYRALNLTDQEIEAARQRST
jgi:hypothetical protein